MVAGDGGWDDGDMRGGIFTKGVLYEGAPLWKGDLYERGSFTKAAFLASAELHASLRGLMDVWV